MKMIFIGTKLTAFLIVASSLGGCVARERRPVIVAQPITESPAVEPAGSGDAKGEQGQGGKDPQVDGQIIVADQGTPPVVISPGTGSAVLIKFRSGEVVFTSWLGDVDQSDESSVTFQ